MINVKITFKSGRSVTITELFNESFEAFMRQNADTAPQGYLLFKNGTAKPIAVKNDAIETIQEVDINGRD